MREHARVVVIGGGVVGASVLYHLAERGWTDAAFTLEDVSERFGTLVIAGPASRAVLRAVIGGGPDVGKGEATGEATVGGGEGDLLSNAAFPWSSAREITLAGIEVLALRVNYLGELGWELHVKRDDQLALYDALMAAGVDHGLRDVGMYAMESMRLEKSYRAWKLDLDHALSPLAAGLERFVDVDKPAGFVGKAALREERGRRVGDGGAPCFVTLELVEPDDAEASPERWIGEGQASSGHAIDAFFGCPIRAGDAVVGTVTSGGYGHRLERGLALGYVAARHADAGTALQVDLLGVSRAARVVPESPYDPENAAPRG